MNSILDMPLGGLLNQLNSDVDEICRAAEAFAQAIREYDPARSEQILAAVRNMRGLASQRVL